MAYITINKENFYHNLNQIALKTGSIEKIAIVLKDNAYGHGLEIMAKLASDFGLKEAVVRNIKEANRISSLFENILVLGGKIVQDDKLTFVINTLEQIDDAQEGARVELKVDTGMHRNGISYEQIETALKMIQARGLNLIGVMTHFRSADELGSAFFWQKKKFSKVKNRIVSLGFKDLRFHSHNSAAILRSKIFEEDLVRVGIGAYGYNELPDVFEEVALRPVMSLYAKKISARVLKKGERVGYGGDFVANKEMTVSTYDLGYGDGWCRGESENPYMTAEGLPILGRVSMDFISLETDNEKVCLMRNAQEAAKQLETISYEVMTALSKDIERIVV